MYISISKEDISQIKVDAVICVDGPSKLMENWLSAEMKKSNTYVNTVSESFNETPNSNNYIDAFKSAIKQANEKKYKTIAIPVIPEAYALQEDTIIKVIHDTINADYDFLIDGIFNRNEYHEQIILIVNNDNTFTNLRAKVRWKKHWSKAREFSFVLDFLDLRLVKKQVFERHFVNDGNYYEYLNKFIEEQKDDLIKNTFRSYREKYPEIEAFMEKLSQLREVYLTMNNTSQNNFKYFLSEEFCIDKLRIAFFNLLPDLLYDMNPLFLLINHLVPDELKGNFINKHEDYVSNNKNKIKLRHDHLVRLLKKIRSLKNTVLPLNLLKSHWDRELWNNVMSSDSRTIETHVKTALARLYNCEPSTIEKAIYSCSN